MAEHGTFFFSFRLRKLYPIVSLEMQDLYSSTWYTARDVSVRLRQPRSILSL